MNTNPTVSRLVARAKITEQPNTRAKADEEGDSYDLSCISQGHYACTHGKNTYIIIEKDGKIGCSCGDMTYRCTGTNACKHIIKFLDLKVPPQIHAPGELIKKLMLIGWVGGKDDLHPAELLKPAQNGSGESESSQLASVMCLHCKTRARRKTQEEADAWLANHLLKCPKNPDNNIPKPQPPANDVAVDETDVSIVPKEQPEPHPAESVVDEPEIYPDEGSWKPDEDNEPLVTAPPSALPSPETVPMNLATALCNMQKIDLLAVTDSNNPFHNAKYADLASVWAAIRKPLTDNGLAVVQTTEQYPNGITVVTTLLHTSGESFTARLSCEIPQSKPDKNGQIKPNIQGLGSTITYLRRYSLTAMVGVAPIDDDGEAAMGRGDKR